MALWRGDEVKYKEAFGSKGSEALAQVAWRGSGCPIPGDTQGQAGRGSEQHDAAVGVPIPCRGLTLEGILRSLPTQTVL